MSTQNINITGKNLSYQYDWFQKTFPPVLQEVFDEFFAEDFTFNLLGVCRNVNSLVDKDSYFVTKIKIDKQHDMFFRLSETAVRLVLDKALGRANGAFDLAKLTELETKIVTTFNDTLYRAVLTHIKPAPPTLTRTNFDVVFMVFVLADNETGRAGRFVVALPDVLVEPEEIQEAFNYPVEHFVKSLISVKLTVGRTMFKLIDVKNLEVDDMVIFENSNIERMRLYFKDYETDVLLKPRMELVEQVDDGGLEMPDDNTNLWDSIEVEMVAYFDSVDITLGELKKIQAGMVVDLVSVYKNRVTLTVEDKPIASGELVIVNDKYGVKITEVHAPKAGGEQVVISDSVGVNPQQTVVNSVSQGVNETVSAGIPGNDDEEEFDYSDFDLEEDI